MPQQLNDRGPTLEQREISTGIRDSRTITTPKYVPPIDLSNSGRADQLIRAGNLYLSLSDAIAMALENNIDVEVSRYTYPINDSALRASHASNGAGVSYDPALTSNINWGHNASISTNSDHRRRTVGQLGRYTSKKLRHPARVHDGRQRHAGVQQHHFDNQQCQRTSSFRTTTPA